jgi:hypothetical protein
MPDVARGDDIIFVTNNLAGTVGEYTTSGATVNPSLITGLMVPHSIAVSGSNLFVPNGSNIKTVGEYTTSGATVNASLITVMSPFVGGLGGIAVSGSNLFIEDTSDNSIGEYTTSGATVNASLITGLPSGPMGIAVSGSKLFVVSFFAGTIGEYTTSGATVNAALITGLTPVDQFGGPHAGPFGIVVSGSNLFVTNSQAGTIGEYTTSGATVNASLVSGLNVPLGLAQSGSNLFVAELGNGTIGEYTTSGATVNASLITGLDSPFGIVVVPEPSTALLLSAGFVGLAVRARRAFGVSSAAQF